MFSNYMEELLIFKNLGCHYQEQKLLLLGFMVAKQSKN